MLEWNDICAGYGSHRVLDGLNAAFGRGKLTAVIGVNGCGKSTLLKSAIGILPVSRGSIRLDGAPLADMRRVDIARRIAYLAQGKATPDMTVMQMVLHGRFPYLGYPRRYSRRDREIAAQAMAQTGVDALAEQPLGTLSGGMRQNAYIAMALAQDTDYILLDEPTTYLDIAHQLQLMRLLRRLADGGKGILAVMHDLPMSFEFADDIAVMHRGQIVLHAAPSEVSRSPLIREIFGVEVARAPQGHYYYAH